VSTRSQASTAIPRSIGLAVSEMSPFSKAWKAFSERVKDILFTRLGRGADILISASKILSLPLFTWNKWLVA
jgi:hypothetical protein